MRKVKEGTNSSIVKKSNIRVFQALLFSLTLGLAPFFPEPHILGKLRWVAGGAVGMEAMDYFDLLLHGAPWLFLIITILHKAFLVISPKFLRH